jgi:hypothetical protein
MRISVSLGLVALLATADSQAVCLLDDYSVEAEYQRSEAVVLASVASERVVPDPDDPEGFAGIIYTLRVQESFRGTRLKTMEVFSENSSGRFPMEKGKAYILFLYRQEGRLSADNCGNSGSSLQKGDVVAAVRRLRQ